MIRPRRRTTVATLCVLVATTTLATAQETPAPPPAPAPQPRQDGERRPRGERGQGRGQAAAGGRMLVTNAVVDGYEGQVQILVLGGQIRQIASSVRAGNNVPRLDVKGARVLPGRIDAWATIPGGDPLGRGIDGLDRRDPVLRQALAQGVTTLFVGPRGGAPLAGVGAIVKLREGGEPAVVSSEAAVCASLGGLDATALQRARLAGELRSAFENARRWREANEEYDEALTKWLSGQAPVVTGSGAPTPGAGGPPPDDAGPRRGPRGPGRRPRPSEQAEDEVGAPEELSLDDPPRPAPPKPDPPKPAPDKPAPDKPAPDKPLPGKPAAEPAKPVPGTPPGKTAGERPKRPGRDAVAKLLLRVLDGELPLRVEAHRAEDIVTALELASELGIPRLIIEGGEEASLVAADLARARVGVVLGPGLEPSLAELGRALREGPLASLARRLAATRTPLAMGSGGLAGSPALAFAAGLHGQQGLGRGVTDGAITTGAAELLGLGGRLGKVAVGHDADLVVVEDDPLAGPLVRATIVDGTIVHRRGQ